MGSHRLDPRAGAAVFGALCLSLFVVACGSPGNAVVSVAPTPVIQPGQGSAAATIIDAASQINAATATAYVRSHPEDLTPPATTPTPVAVRNSRQYSSPPRMAINQNAVYTATVVTTKGTFVIELLPQLAPQTVNSFVFLARRHFFDGVSFHRYVPNFVIQGGDPTGTGTGGPGYQFDDELPPPGVDYHVGTVAMANAGPNTNGSQFFICLTDEYSALEQARAYAIFGQVMSGMQVVDALRQGDIMKSVTITSTAP